MANEDKFTGKAAVYDQFRPAYPTEALDWLMEQCALGREDPVADIGAGTGILTGQLLQRHLRVWAVEPNSDMRAVLNDKMGEERALTIVNAPAEHTGLSAKSMRLVAVAQAFHWFDRDAFRTECQRILMRNSKVAILYNNRPAMNPLVQESASIFHRHCPDFVGYSGGIGALTPDKVDFFRHGSIRVQTFPNPFCYTLEGYLGHVRSASYFPGEDAAAATLVDELTELWNRNQKDGIMQMPNFTEVFLGEV